MEKKCISIRTSDFEKSLKEAGPQHAQKINDIIKKLEEVESNPKLLPDGVRSAEAMFGKHLNELNKNIYVLEASRKLRAMAVVMHQEDKKVYVWFWGGQHEKYNEKLKAKILDKQESNIKLTQEENIKTKFLELDKDKVSLNINKMRENLYKKNKPQY